MRERIIYIGGFLLCVVFGYTFFVYVNQEKPLVVSFLDVGQGSGAYIKTPSGYEVLVDSGETNKSLRALAKERSFLDFSIDLAIATHPDRDHIGMFPELLSRYHIPRMIQTPKQSGSPEQQALSDSQVSHHVEIVYPNPGELYELPDGVRMHVLYPPQRDIDELSDNESSIIFRLSYKGTSFLFTGDATARTEREVARRFPDLVDTDVLLVSHHGSKSSSDPDFLDAVSAQYAVISAGADNRYGHPHKQTIDRLVERGVYVLQTGALGTIRFEVSQKGEMEIDY